jgi:hypothetical protein
MIESAGRACSVLSPCAGVVGVPVIDLGHLTAHPRAEYQFVLQTIGFEYQQRVVRIGDLVAMARMDVHAFFKGLVMISFDAFYTDWYSFYRIDTRRRHGSYGGKNMDQNSHFPPPRFRGTPKRRRDYLSPLGIRHPPLP